MMQSDAQSDHERVLRALTTVPEKRLLIIDLATELTNKEGALDYEQVRERLPDINLAVAEAQVYAKATATAINALKQIPARGQDIGFTPGPEGPALMEMLDE